MVIIYRLHDAACSHVRCELWLGSTLAGARGFQAGSDVGFQELVSRCCTFERMAQKTQSGWKYERAPFEVFPWPGADGREPCGGLVSIGSATQSGVESREQAICRRHARSSEKQVPETRESRYLPHFRRDLRPKREPRLGENTGNEKRAYNNKKTS